MQREDFKVSYYTDYRSHDNPYALAYGLLRVMISHLAAGNASKSRDRYIVFKIERVARAFGIPSQAFPISPHYYQELVRQDLTAIVAPYISQCFAEIRKWVPEGPDHVVHEIVEGLSLRNAREVVEAYHLTGAMTTEEMETDVFRVWLRYLNIEVSELHGWAAYQSHVLKQKITEARRLVGQIYAQGPWGARPLREVAEYKASFERHFRLWLLLHEGVSETDAKFDCTRIWESMQSIIDNGRHLVREDRTAPFKSTSLWLR